MIASLRRRTIWARGGVERANHVAYRKGELVVGITPELRLDTDGKAKATCVRRIGL